MLLIRANWGKKKKKTHCPVPIERPIRASFGKQWLGLIFCGGRDAPDLLILLGAEWAALIGLKFSWTWVHHPRWPFCSLCGFCLHTSDQYSNSSTCCGATSQNYILICVCCHWNVWNTGTLNIPYLFDKCGWISFTHWYILVLDPRLASLLMASLFHSWFVRSFSSWFPLTVAISVSH